MRIRSIKFVADAGGRVAARRPGSLLLRRSGRAVPVRRTGIGGGAVRLRAPPQGVVPAAWTSPMGRREGGARAPKSKPPGFSASNPSAIDRTTGPAIKPPRASELPAGISSGSGRESPPDAGASAPRRADPPNQDPIRHGSGMARGAQSGLVQTLRSPYFPVSSNPLQ